jgi:hypothetical protein
LPAPARAQGEVPLRIVTVPTLTGVRFLLDGRPFASHGDGVATITATPGRHQLSVLPWTSREGDARARFSRWLDDIYRPSRPVDLVGPLQLQVGLEVMRQVTFRYIDLHGDPVDPKEISAVVLKSSLGATTTFRATSRVQWLDATRAVRRLNGLEAAHVQYAVDRVMVSGTTVVNRSQQRFFAARTSESTIRLLFYRAQFTARDALFGFKIGSGVKLVFPDGHAERFGFTRDGGVTVPSLPRGEYQVKVDALGLSPPQPVALSKDQDVEVQVLSYLDIAVMALFVGGLALGLLFIGRPHLLRLLVVRAGAVLGQSRRRWRYHT